MSITSILIVGVIILLLLLIVKTIITILSWWLIYKLIRIVVRLIYKYLINK